MSRPIPRLSRQVGERSATRVRVNAPQGSRYDGKTGVLVDILYDTWFVRFGRDERPLPFAEAELETVG